MKDTMKDLVYRGPEKTGLRVQQLNTYVLGILWALGSYEEHAGTKTISRYFQLRHHRPYFLQVVEQEMALQTKIRTVRHNGKPQFRLNIYDINIEYLNWLGWQARQAVERNYPFMSVGHRDFILAYLEIHSKLDTTIILKRYERPRLRIYGNMRLLAELTRVLAAEVGTGIKKPQQVKNRESGISGTLFYQSLQELRALFKYFYNPPLKHFDHEYYEKFSGLLREWPD